MKVDATTAFAEARYRADASRIASVAAELREAGKPMHARKFAMRAYIALNAARAEVFDPETVVGPECGCEMCDSHRFHVRFAQIVGES